MSNNTTILATKTDDDDVWQMRLTLVALLIAIAALFIAFFQVLLQYLSSPQRDKCLTGAIGTWSNFTRTRWDLSRWRIRVKYSKINLSPWMIIHIRQSQEAEILKWVQEQGRDYHHTSIGGSGIGRFDLTHGSLVLRHPNDPQNTLSFWMLPFKEKITWAYFRICHWRSCPGFARAGWVNILSALNVCPDIRLMDGLQDADIIPSAVDAPFQVVDLNTLGLLCYMLGLRDVKIDESSGTIDARNAYLRIQTLTIPAVGQVVAIDGDFESLRKQLHTVNSEELMSVLRSATGHIHVNMFQPSIHFFDEGAGLYGLFYGWNSDMWESYRIWVTTNLIVQNPSHEIAVKASLTAQCTAYKNEAAVMIQVEDSWSAIWNSLIRSATPTIIKYMAFLPFMPIWSAQPGESFFAAYNSYLNKSRANYMKNLGQNFVPNIEFHAKVEFMLATNRVPFIRPKSEFLLTKDTGAMPDVSRSWAIEPSIPILRSWPGACDVVDQILNPNLPLLLPNAVIQLLKGGPMQEVRTGLEQYVMETEIAGYTLESTIYLALMFLDARIQTLWCKAEGTDDGPLTGFYKVPEVTLSEQCKLMGHIRFHPSAAVVDFLGCWMDICTKIDAVGDTILLIEALHEVLAEWATADEHLCYSIMDGFISDPSPEETMRASYQRIATNDRDPRQKHISQVLSGKCRSGQPMTKSKFAEWVKADKNRLREMEKILPLLQLRIWLMQLCYGCYADSPMVCKARMRRGTRVEVRLI
ncbi:hypothetical protein TWF679_010298 [Orbilia oligospora]|uniref:Uncharacterized protein n=1 Tax=Orbilia oligospora TaxID=2813651 RepID=A0A8H8VIU1_ORBOL|nr:hypothetical protein TWF679_010298 [Orbilia oligospora]